MVYKSAEMLFIFEGILLFDINSVILNTFRDFPMQFSGFPLCKYFIKYYICIRITKLINAL